MAGRLTGPGGGEGEPAAPPAPGGTQAAGNLGDNESIFDVSAADVPPSLAKIAPILRVADEVEQSNPRVAFLCRFYAIKKVIYRLDPTCRGRGVRLFMTLLLRRLEVEGETTVKGRVERTDQREMESFYKHYYKTHIRNGDRAQAYQTAAVLFQTLNTISPGGRLTRTNWWRASPFCMSLVDLYWWRACFGHVKVIPV